MTSLPTTELDSVATINPRLSRSLDDDETVSFLGMADVSEDGTTSAGEDRSYSDVRKGFTPFKNGDILIAKITPCFQNGKIVQADVTRNHGFGSTEFHVVRTGDDLDPRYLLHYLRQPIIRVEGERRMTGSGGQRRVPTEYVKNLQIPLPPIKEQRRIAAILDHADALRAKRREALAHLDELTQSIFIDMFGDPASNPSGYPVRTLGEIAEFYAGGTLPEGEDFVGQADGFALLKVSDLNLPGNERVLRSSQGWSAHPGTRSATCPAGSVVIPKRGGAIGTNKKRLTSRPSILDPNLMAIKPQQSQLGLEFLYAWFERLDLNSLISGSSVPQLNKKDLAPLVIPVPPYELQLEFAARTNIIGHIRSGHRANLVELDALFASLQSRAFRGEL